MELKKLVLSLLSLSMMMIMTGCSKKYELMSHYITGPFDTITTYMSYVSSEDEFNEQCDYIEEQLNYYDQLFDKYNTYNGMNNLKTINDNAGKKAIEVDQPLIDLLNLSIERKMCIRDRTYTPPTNGEIFKEMMERYRIQRSHHDD